MDLFVGHKSHMENAFVVKVSGMKTTKQRDMWT
jgi:hypothetical protein